ncbi:hypothetical protein VXQ18_17195 [Brucella abortus]|nr:hypothetical protein [Brucella abortus]
MRALQHPDRRRWRPFQQCAKGESLYPPGRARPPMVKADGLAASRGVVAADDASGGAVMRSIHCFEGAFSAAERGSGGIEEFLDGARQQASPAPAVARRHCRLAVAQDHKPRRRWREGGRARIAGGMGAPCAPRR